MSGTRSEIIESARQGEINNVITQKTVDRQLKGKAIKRSKGIRSEDMKSSNGGKNGKDINSKEGKSNKEAKSSKRGKHDKDIKSLKGSKSLESKGAKSNKSTKSYKGPKISKDGKNKTRSRLSPKKAIKVRRARRHPCVSPKRAMLMLIPVGNGSKSELILVGNKK